VISTIALVAIYQTLITQERTYRYQTAAIDAQGTSRMALQVIASELREISASAGQTAGFAGTDLLMATRDSMRIRALRKVGIVCSLAGAGVGSIDVWVPGTLFASGDQIMFYQPGSTNTLDDDAWNDITLGAVAVAIDPACATTWGTYPVQALVVGVGNVGGVAVGSIVRSYTTMSYGNYTYDGMNVLGRRTGATFEPLVGPLLSNADGGLTLRYFDNNNTELMTLTTDAQRSAVSRILITVRAVSRGGDPMGGDWVDSVSTNVYLRGN
jgi:hypothetical protein